MSRIIDADKLYPDRMTNKGTVAISQSQIAKAPTIHAIPIDRIEQARKEIEFADDTTYGNYKKIVLSILDKLIAESEDKK